MGKKNLLVSHLVKKSVHLLVWAEVTKNVMKSQLRKKEASRLGSFSASLWQTIQPRPNCKYLINDWFVPLVTFPRLSAKFF